MSDEYYGPGFNYKVSGGPNSNNKRNNKGNNTGNNTDKPLTKAEKAQAVGNALTSIANVAGSLKDKGLDYTPSATSVRSGASKGAAYIGSFDEYNTEDAAGSK